MKFIKEDASIQAKSELITTNTTNHVQMIDFNESRKHEKPKEKSQKKDFFTIKLWGFMGILSSIKFHHFWKLLRRGFSSNKCRLLQLLSPFSNEFVIIKKVWISSSTFLVSISKDMRKSSINMKFLSKNYAGVRDIDVI